MSVAGAVYGSPALFIEAPPPAPVAARASAPAGGRAEDAFGAPPHAVVLASVI